LHQALQDGHCPILGLDPAQGRANLRTILGQLMLVAEFRPAMAAFVYRMTRCEPADQRAIGHLIEAIFGGGVQPASYSWLLGMNITVSELWEPEDPSAEELQARYADTVMCRGVSNLIANQAPVWSRYDEPLLAAPVMTEIPTLMVQAEYDPATPVDIAQPMSDALAGADHRFVVVKHASHTVISQSPLAEDPSRQCGLEILRAFMADPAGALPDCAQATRPPRFNGTPEYNQFVYGLPDLWENPPE
jgi:pimeloyl-ACP methyl ester carboxylesterase